MKLKTFGLIEAIIGSTIVIIFVVAMALVAVKANKVSQEYLHRQIAQKIADDFMGRLIILRNTGRLDFNNEVANKQTISISCFSTDQGQSCKNSIIDAYPQNIFPFFDMISDKSLGNYKLLSENYLRGGDLPSDFFRIKTQVNDSSCGDDSSIKCKKIKLEIIWDEPSGSAKKLFIDQLIADSL